MEKVFQVSLAQFILHKFDEEVDGYNEEQLFPDSVSECETDLSFLLSYLPERVSCFARTKQLCIKNCLQDSEF